MYRKKKGHFRRERKSTCYMKKKRREIKTISKWFKIHVSEGNENARECHYRTKAWNGINLI